MRAEIIAVGTELLTGETADTNSSWLASQMPSVGLEVQWITVAGDDPDRLTDIITRAWARSDYVFTMGGLGPTLDDITRDCIATMLGQELKTSPDLVEWLESNFRRRGMPMPAQNLRQAGVIDSATPILNPRGTAPGWWVESNDKVLVTMPGPPGEMMHMWSNEISPRLKQRVVGSVILSRTFKTIGLGEAAVDEMVKHVYDFDAIDLGCYAKPDGIYLRAIAKAPSDTVALLALDQAEELIRNALESYIWGIDEETPQGRMGELLKQHGYTIAILESCTGGMVSAAITDVPGSSEYFLGGGVPYTEQAKIAMGVPEEILAQHGVVSSETARALASAACTLYGAQCGIGITGVAGPTELDGKPVGTVFIGVRHPGGESVEEYNFPSRRPLVRNRTVTMALLQMSRELLK